MAIEALSASCCASSHLSSQDKPLTDGGISDAGDCRDCIDLLLSAQERGVVLQSPGQGSANSFAVECFCDQLLAGGFSRCFKKTLEDINAAVPFSSSVPLRC